MDVTAELVRARYAALKCARRDAFTKAEVAAQCKAAYEELRAAKIIDGTITGKNEMEREASARSLLADECAAYLDTARNARWAEHYLNLALVGVEEIRLLVRLEEAARLDLITLAALATVPVAEHRNGGN